MTAGGGGLGWRVALAAMSALAAAFVGVGIALAVVLPAERAGLLATVLGVGFAIGAVVTAVAVGRATRGAARTLRETARASELVTRGASSPRIPGLAPGEAGVAARAFNAMLDAIDSRIRAIGAGRRQLETILATMANGVVIVNADETTASMNPAAEALLGVDAGSSIGRSLVDSVRDHELVAICREAGRSGAAVNRLLHLPATDRHVRAVATPVRQGDTHQVLLLLQDVTELRQTEEVRRDFVANVSHELRTPGASLKALVETLEAGAIDDVEARAGFLARMRGEVDRIIALVEELLELARIESGRAGVSAKEVSLSELAGSGAERLRPQAERAGIVFHVARPVDDVTVRVDPDQTDRVVTNLLQNAIKFTPAGGRVSIAVEGRDGQARLSVADTGVGIDRDDLPRVFERFYKADRSRAGGGAGLGLAIAKHLVLQQGGRIWAESEGLSRGAEFVVTFARARRAD